MVSIGGSFIRSPRKCTLVALMVSVGTIAHCCCPLAYAFAPPRKGAGVRPSYPLLRPCVSRREPRVLLRESGDGGDRGVEDPNPGGLNNWGGNNNGDEGEDESILDQLRSWLKSEEGKEDVQTYTVSLGIALLLRLLIIEPRYIPSLSMYPTFDIGDQLAVEKVTKRVRPMSRNEIVVFNPPQNFRDIINTQYGGSNKKAKEALIKRIVAIEGDKVEVQGGKLFINDIRQDEPFTAEDAAYEFGPVFVPPKEVLVLGDNRNHSLDGHIWGFLPKENIIGRAVFIYWPPWRVGNEGMY